LFEAMNRDWWAGPTEAYIYNEFAEALHEGMRLGVLHLDDLLTEDDHVLAKLEASGSPLITAKLEAVRRFRPESLSGYQPRVIPKERWLDPPVQTGQTFERLSVLEGRARPASQPPLIADEPGANPL
jgi:hypothetical protein